MQLLYFQMPRGKGFNRSLAAQKRRADQLARQSAVPEEPLSEQAPVSEWPLLPGQSAVPGELLSDPPFHPPPVENRARKLISLHHLLNCVR